MLREAGPNEEDPLQQMMKDQFGNYVVQKVLEVCDERQREMLLARVRVQLHALKKYTYGKHIVARVEKLLFTGTKLQGSGRGGSGAGAGPAGRALPDDAELLQLQQQMSFLAERTAEGSPVKGGAASPAASEAGTPVQDDAPARISSKAGCGVAAAAAAAEVLAL